MLQEAARKKMASFGTKSPVNEDVNESIVKPGMCAEEVRQPLRAQFQNVN